MKKDLDLKELLKSYREGSATADEHSLLERWYNAVPSGIGMRVTEQELQDAKNSMWMGLQSELGISQEKKGTIPFYRRWTSVAAVLIILGLGAATFYVFDAKKDASAAAVADIAPGKNGAILTLSNGKRILVNDALAGNIASESGVKISKTADGQIVYTVSDVKGENTNASNTLQTSNGEQTQIRLPDGTIVFLNAASSLKYPTSFASKAKRAVELSGEGYFQVSRDKAHPFVVKTARQEVEVLGTKFNINSYESETVIRTTLIEGSVKVTGADKISKILRPNQQAVNSAYGIKVLDVEAQFFIDWKEGFFMFNNENLESIVNRVSRWYNVKVVFADPSLKTEIVTGTISKYENISSVVRILKRSGLAEFQIENNVLRISKKK